MDNNEIKIECPRKERYGKCVIKGCGYCDKHDCETMPKQKTLEKQKCEQCKDLPEGEVVSGHDHRFKTIEQIRYFVVDATSPEQQNAFDFLSEKINELIDAHNNNG